jgi:peptidyl-prolyl cis-trans isomerase SurA
MTARRIVAAIALAGSLLALPGLSSPVLAETQGVVVVVNDKPVTELDITQRIALLKIVGDGRPEGMSRKQALQSLIDEQVKIAEATRLKLLPTDADVKDQIGRMAKNMKVAPDELLARLKKQGISDTTFRQYVRALMGFNRIISSKYRSDITVSDSDIDAKFNDIKTKANAQISKIMSDPRMKGVTVFSLLEITLPVEADDAMLLQSRAIEARQFLQRFKGCGNARAAADGIFNVKIGKKFEADAAKLPPQMRAALEKAGQGKAVGPMRNKAGIQLVAFCGSRKMTPPKPDFKMPTREQVERALINEKYDGLEEDYLKTIRGNVYVEYRKSGYAQQ